MHLKKINLKFWAALIAVLLCCPSFLFAAERVIESDQVKLIMDFAEGLNIPDGDVLRLVYIGSVTDPSALLRDISGNPSYWGGSFWSNYSVIFVNTSGITFGANANIQAASFIASTLDINNDNFLHPEKYNNTYIFSKWADKTGKSIINNGYIKVNEGGQVVLLASAVANRNTIEASLGRVVLAAGEAITLNLDTAGMISVVIAEPVKEQIFDADGNRLTSAVENSGTILANGGKVVLAAKVLNDVFDYAVNNSGVIEARSVINHSGVVELSGEGAPVVNTGSIIVNGSIENPNAGTIALNGPIVLQKGLISANAEENGNAGNIDIVSETSTVLDEGSRTEARALGLAGNGGRIKIDTRKGSTFIKNATIDISAGSVSGNGGYVEISAFDQLGFYGVLNGRAPPGYTPGLFCIDPPIAIIGSPFWTTYLSANFTVWATGNIYIIGEVVITGAYTLNIFADHKDIDPRPLYLNLVWDDGVGEVFCNNIFGYIRGASATVNIKGGNGIGRTRTIDLGWIAFTSAPIKLNVASLSAEINPASSGNIWINQGVNPLSVTYIITLNGNVELDTAGDLYLGIITASGNVDISCAGAIIDNNGNSNNISALNLILSAANGIGSGDALETQVSNLDATNTSANSIEIANTGALNLIDLNSDGYAITNAGGAIDISTASPLTVTDPVVASGDITLYAGGHDDLTIGANVISSNGAINLAADRDIFINAGLISSGANSINIRADYDTAYNLPGYIYGGAIYQPGGQIGHGTESIWISADGNVKLSNVRGDNVWIGVYNGSISDYGSTSIFARDLALYCPSLGINLHTAVSRLFALNQNGDIIIENNGTLTLVDLPKVYFGVSWSGYALKNLGGNVYITTHSDLIFEAPIIAEGFLVSLKVDGAVYDINSGFDVIADSLELRTVNGILSFAPGWDDVLETMVNNLAAYNSSSGPINIVNSGDLTITTVGSTTGVTNNALYGDIDIRAYSVDVITEHDPIYDGGGNIVGWVVKMFGSMPMVFNPPGASLNIDEDVTANGGDISLYTDEDINQNANIATNSIGTINLNARHAITMAGGVSTTANLGDITYTALTGDINVAHIENNGEVTITAGGAIIDANDIVGVSIPGGIVIYIANLNIIANNLILYAANGIGSGDALETEVSNLAAYNSTSGDISIDNTGNLTVATLNGVEGIKNYGGNIMVSVHSNLTLDAPTYANGGVWYIADGDIIHNANGDVTTRTGDYIGNADSDGNGSGKYLINPGATIWSFDDSNFAGYHDIYIIAGKWSGGTNIVGGQDIIINSYPGNSANYWDFIALNPGNGNAYIMTGAGNIIGNAYIATQGWNVLLYAPLGRIGGNNPAEPLNIKVVNLAALAGGDINILERTGLNVISFAGVNGILAGGNIHLEVGDVNYLNPVFGPLDLVLTAKIESTLAGAGGLAIIKAPYSAIIDNNGNNINIIVTNLIISAKNGIGSSNALETQVSNLQATNTTSGSIEIHNSGSLTLTDVLGTLGYAVYNPGDGVHIWASSPLLVNSKVEAKGLIVLEAEGGASGDLTINARVYSVMGMIILNASNDIRVTQTGEVITNGKDISLNAGRDAYVHNISTGGASFSGKTTIPDSGTVRVTAGGRIEDGFDVNDNPDDVYDISAHMIILDAAGGIATDSLAPIELRSNGLSILKGGVVNLYHLGELHFYGFNGTSFTLINRGDLYIEGPIITNGGNIRLIVIDDPNLYILANIIATNSGPVSVLLAAVNNVIIRNSLVLAISLTDTARTNILAGNNIFVYRSLIGSFSVLGDARTNLLARDNIVLLMSAVGSGSILGDARTILLAGDNIISILSAVVSASFRGNASTYLVAGNNIISVFSLIGSLSGFGNAQTNLLARGNIFILRSLVGARSFFGNASTNIAGRNVYIWSARVSSRTLYGRAYTGIFATNNIRMRDADIVARVDGSGIASVNMVAFNNICSRDSFISARVERYGGAFVSLFAGRNVNLSNTEVGAVVGRSGIALVNIFAGYNIRLRDGPVFTHIGLNGDARVILAAANNIYVIRSLISSYVGNNGSASNLIFAGNSIIVRRSLINSYVDNFGVALNLLVARDIFIRNSLINAVAYRGLAANILLAQNILIDPSLIISSVYQGVALNLILGSNVIISHSAVIALVLDEGIAANAVLGHNVFINESILAALVLDEGLAINAVAGSNVFINRSILGAYAEDGAAVNAVLGRNVLINHSILGAVVEDGLALTTLIASNDILLLGGSRVGAYSISGTARVNLLAGNDIIVRDSSIQALTLTGDATIVLYAVNNVEIGYVEAVGGTATVYIIALSGSITDNNAAAINVVSQDLILYADQGISLDTAVSRLQAINVTSGDIDIENYGDLILEALYFQTHSVYNGGGNVDILTHSSLTVNAPIYAFANITLTAGETPTPGPGDDLTINADIISKTGNILLRAGDCIIQNPSTIITLGLGKTITLIAGYNDVDGIGCIQQNGVGGTLGFVGIPTQIVTNNGDISLFAIGDISLTLLDAGKANVYVTSSNGSIKDTDLSYVPLDFDIYADPYGIFLSAPNGKIGGPRPYEIDYIGPPTAGGLFTLQTIYILTRPYVFAVPEILLLYISNPIDPATSANLMAGRGVNFYQPLTPTDTAAFDNMFTLGAGAYNFIDGAINIVGHDGLLPMLEELKKKKKGATL